MLAVFLFYAIFSSTYVIAGKLLSISQPAFLTGIRMAVSGALILLYLYLFRRKDFTLFPREHTWDYVKVAVIQIFLCYVPEYWAQKRLGMGGSTKVSLLFALTPFFTALFSHILLKELLTKKKIMGLAVGFVGALILILSDNAPEGAAMGQSIISSAEIALLFAVAAYAYGWVIKRSMVAHHNLDVLTVNGVTMVWGGLLAFASSPFIDVWNPWPVTDIGTFIPLAALMIFIGGVFGFNAYAWLLKRNTASFVALAGGTESLYVAFYSWLFFAQKITTTFFIAFAVIAYGLYLFYQEELRQGYISKD